MQANIGIENFKIAVTRMNYSSGYFLCQVHLNSINGTEIDAELNVTINDNNLSVIVGEQEFYAIRTVIFTVRILMLCDSLRSATMNV